MSAAGLLAREYDLMYRTAEMNLKGMTREHSLVQPSPSGNCANWILAHLVDVQNSVMEVAGAEPVWDDESEETLSDGLEDPFGEPCRRAELLALLLTHQMYHVGQLGLSRRLAGLPGAIRGPGKET